MLPIVQKVVHSEVYLEKEFGTYYECVHPWHVIACHVRASGQYIAGREYTARVKPPYMGILPAGERDANGLVGPFKLVWAGFHWDGLKSEGGEHVSLALGEARVHRSHTRHLNPSELQVVLRLFRELETISKRPDLPSQLRSASILIELMAMWAEPASAQAGEERAVRLYRSLIEQHAEQPEVSLSDLAERVGFSPDHLGEIFHKEMGMTPVAYRTRLRLARAKELLISTPMPISEIARDTGFPDANYFSRVFRRSYGMSPREYAKSYPPGSVETKALRIETEG
jgi:AraC-like DNA-binding protein